MFGYFKIPGVILSLGSSQKLNWTHTFDTHCKYTTSVQFYVRHKMASVRHHPIGALTLCQATIEVIFRLFRIVIVF